jgi:hypothetical protein
MPDGRIALTERQNCHDGPIEAFLTISFALNGIIAFNFFKFVSDQAE